MARGRGRTTQAASGTSSRSTSNNPHASRRQPNQTTLVEDGEVFDLNVSDSEGNKDGLPMNQTRTRPQGVQGTQGERTQINDPTPAKKAEEEISDVDYYYEQTKEGSVCKPCRRVFLPFLTFLTYQNNTHRAHHNANPSQFPRNINYSYKPSTSTTSLRPHLLKCHLEEYLKFVDEGKWINQFWGYSEASQSSKTARAQSERPDMFNYMTFHQHLLNFIVADDQVHFYYPLRLTLTYVLVPISVSKRYRMPQI
jgi:hypothetical protein